MFSWDYIWRVDHSSKIEMLHKTEVAAELANDT